mgnify:CR=1 FL=1
MLAEAVAKKISDDITNSDMVNKLVEAGGYKRDNEILAKQVKELLEHNRDKLSKFGYEIEFMSDHEVIFKKVPQILSKVAPKEILADILENISGDIDNIEEKILITTSCKAAVKANTYLNMFQMQEIIKNWRKCEKPFTCPHGRPISHIIEHKDIAKFFQRNK